MYIIGSGDVTSGKVSIFMIMSLARYHFHHHGCIHFQAFSTKNGTHFCSFGMIRESKQIIQFCKICVGSVQGEVRIHFQLGTSI